MKINARPCKNNNVFQVLIFDSDIEIIHELSKKFRNKTAAMKYAEKCFEQNKKAYSGTVSQNILLHLKREEKDAI